MATPGIAPRTRRLLLRWETLPLAVVVVLLAAAIAPGLFTDVSPYDQSLSARLLPPLSDGHLLGTDGLGRDVLARLVHGARPTVIVAASSLVISAGIGTAVGLLSGMFGGWVDAVLMRLTDTMLALPMILFALFLVILTGPSITNVVIAIGVLAWARYARVIRGETLVVRQQDYVAQARISGVSWPRIMLRHLLPNVAPAVLVLVTLQVGWVVLVESTLSFLGAGIPPPNPSWGGMVSDGRAVMTTAWWVAGVPGIAILLLVISLNSIGDRVRDHFDPMLD